MARTTFLLLVALAASAQLCHAQKPGTSCQEFDASMCDGKPDGIFYENIADCGSPFCHTTYVVCYSGAPTVQNCPDETVWSQELSTCINRGDAPGGCPATCGLLNSTMCKDTQDGTLQSNPTDCKYNNQVGTFLYCIDETPIITYCPSDSYWNEDSMSCMLNGETVEIMAPIVPGLVAPAMAPVEVPAMAPEHDDHHDTHLVDDEDVYAPAIAPEVAAEAPATSAVVPDTSAMAPAPSMAEPITPQTFTFGVSAKDLSDLGATDVESVLRNVTGIDVEAMEPSDYKMTLDLAMPSFGYLVDDATKQDLTDSINYLVGNALSEYVATENILVEDISRPVSTASTGMNDDTLSATIVLLPNDGEKQSMTELVSTMPEFETLFAMAVERMTNETAKELGISSEVHEYIQSGGVTVGDYNVEAQVTVTHKMGDKGMDALASAVETGDLAREMSDVMGQQFTAEFVASAPAPAPGTRDIVIDEGNGAAIHGMAGLLTALAGAVVTLAMLL